MYPVRENARNTNVFIITFCLNLMYVNVITYCIIKKITVAVGVQHNEDIATWFLLEVFKGTINADCSGDTADDQGVD